MCRHAQCDFLCHIRLCLVGFRWQKYATPFKPPNFLPLFFTSKHFFLHASGAGPSAGSRKGEVSGGHAKRALPERSEWRRSAFACVRMHARTHARTHCTYALHAPTKKIYYYYYYYVVCAAGCVVRCAAGCAVGMLQTSMNRGMRCAAGCAVVCAAGCAVRLVPASRRAAGNVKRAGAVGRVRLGRLETSNGRPRTGTGNGNGSDGDGKRVGWGSETARAGRRLATAASEGRQDTCSDKSPLTTLIGAGAWRHPFLGF